MKTAIALVALMGAAMVQAAEPAGAGQASDRARASASDSSETIAVGSDKVVCRREMVSGSRVNAKRICRTAAEWERQRREDQQAAEKIQAARSKS